MTSINIDNILEHHTLAQIPGLGNPGTSKDFNESMMAELINRYKSTAKAKKGIFMSLSMAAPYFIPARYMI